MENPRAGRRARASEKAAVKTDSDDHKVDVLEIPEIGEACIENFEVPTKSPITLELLQEIETLIAADNTTNTKETVDLSILRKHVWHPEKVADLEEKWNQEDLLMDLTTELHSLEIKRLQD